MGIIKKHGSFETKMRSKNEVKKTFKKLKKVVDKQNEL